MSFFTAKPISIDSVILFVKAGIDQDLTLGVYSDADRQLQDCLNNCNNGNPQNKERVKEVIADLLVNGNTSIISDLPSDFTVTKTNIDRIINWANPGMLNSYYLFLATLLHYKKTYAADALGYLIDKYHFNQLRMRGAEGLGFYIDQQDIRTMWDAENLLLDYETKFNILVQICYERLYGAGCIDELLYQNVGDISVGVSGVHEAGCISNEVDMPAYCGYWLNYRGCSIHFLFPYFESEQEIIMIGTRIVNASFSGSQLDKSGFKVGYGKDGSKRMIATKPFGEGPAIWIHKATEQSSISNSLYGDIENYQVLQQVEAALVKGGLTIPVCGARGAGKTLKLESLIQYVQNFYAIRVLETESETNLRQKYPFKNIYSVQSNESTSVSADTAWNFTLRSDGDVFVIGDTQDDRMMGNIARSANRFGRNFLFTFLAKSPALVISEIANAMLREKMYSNLQDATAAALNFVHCCIFVSQDIESGQYFYEIFEFVVDEEEPWCYTIVPLVEYDRLLNRYQLSNKPSKALYEEMLVNTPLASERLELEKLNQA